MEANRIINILYGPIQSGKSTFYRFIRGLDFNIRKSELDYQITLKGLPYEEEVADKTDNSENRIESFGKFCELQYMNEENNEIESIETMIHLLNEIQYYDYFRLILFIDESDFYTSNCKKFISFTNDLIKIFKLTKDDLKSIKLIVTKTTDSFFSNIPEFLEEILAEENNLIINSIRKSIMPICKFNKPELPDGVFSFHKQDRDSFLDTFRVCETLSCEEKGLKILQRLEKKLRKIKKSGNTNQGLVFTSLNYSPFISSNILVIDEDIYFAQKELVFKAETIIVVPPSPNKLLYCDISDNDPKIIFDSQILRVINGKSLVLSTRNTQKDIQFPDPTDSEFNSNTRFFRLESICINSNWTEYASHNNKFIDMIVYLNPSFGKIEVDKKFLIKTLQIDLRVKFYLNECMRTKGNIQNTFLSIRNCKNIEEYLEKVGKQNIDNEIKAGLDEYVVRLPNIFQIFMKTEYLGEFSGSRSDMDELLRIKGLLIYRYLDLVSDIQRSKIEIELNEKLLESLANFNQFCYGICGKNIGEISRKNKNLRRGLKKNLNHKNLPGFSMLNYLSVFDYLSTCEEKGILFKYNITGDLSLYQNYHSLVNQHLLMNLSIDDFKNACLNLSNGIMIGGGIALGVGAGRYFLLRATGSLAVRAGISSARIAASVAGAVMIVGELGINLICALAKSKYLDGEFQPDPKFYRLDL